MTVEELISQLEGCENINSKVYFSDGHGNDYWIESIDDQADATYIECHGCE
ncbi:hypothetical protein [Lactiplantibacillus herbarum]|uniref:hypothetical protein n=1 Tax=Lactiplantibacillus herbarum TaxID=1670446 RepID=UPI000AB6AD0B|nr:hypothetical protein [Lactiplantibacillus herbarum]